MLAMSSTQRVAVLLVLTSVACLFNMRRARTNESMIS